MKRNLFLWALGLAAAFLTAKTSAAQQTDKTKIVSVEAYKAKMATAEADKLALISLNALSTKAFKDFSRFFSDASDIRIISQPKAIFVSCISKGIRNRVYYTDKGRWVNTLRYYNADNLPQDVAELVQQEYPGFTLTNVIEVNVGDKTAHLVSIENKTAWKRIKVADGQLEVYESYKKP